jgi:hypothetical protein
MFMGLGLSSGREVVFFSTIHSIELSEPLVTLVNMIYLHRCEIIEVVTDMSQITDSLFRGTAKVPGMVFATAAMPWMVISRILIPMAMVSLM